MSENQFAEWSYHRALSVARSNRELAASDSSIKGAFAKVLAKEWMLAARRIRLARKASV